MRNHRAPVDRARVRAGAVERVEVMEGDTARARDDRREPQLFAGRPGAFERGEPVGGRVELAAVLR